jgi:hypothetical protein
MRSATSRALAHRAISAGCLSIIALYTARALSNSASSGPMIRPARPGSSSIASRATDCLLLMARPSVVDAQVARHDPHDRV